MRNYPPIYNLLHQEIKACADHLLEMSQKPEFCADQDGTHVLGRLNDLHQFANKIRSDEHYMPLSELKAYLENTMLCFEDDQNQLHSMRLSEAISLLGFPEQTDIPFKPSIVKSLLQHFVSHFLENVKPGRPLFRRLHDIKKI